MNTFETKNGGCSKHGPYQICGHNDITCPDNKVRPESEVTRKFSLPWNQVAIKSGSSIEIISMQDTQQEPQVVGILDSGTSIKAENLVFCAELKFSTLTNDGKRKEITMHCPGPFALKEMVEKYFSSHEQEKITGSIRCGYDGEKKKEYPEIDNYRVMVREVFEKLGFTGLFYINDRLKQ